MSDQHLLDCENHSQCQLTIKCCVCRDKRTDGHYTEYVDGNGILHHSSRTKNYCPGCKLIPANIRRIHSPPNDYQELTFTNRYSKRVDLPVYERSLIDSDSETSCCSIQ